MQNLLPRIHRRKAIFLDREGVLIPHLDDNWTAGDVALLPGTAEAVARINQSEYLAVAVTDQAAVAGGVVPFDQFEASHARLDALLQQRDARLDGVSACPTREEMAAGGCKCRKPCPGMLLRAAKQFGIDLPASILIASAVDDLQAGHRTGLTTVLIGTPEVRHGGPPDFTFANLTRAVRFLMEDYRWGADRAAG